MLRVLLAALAAFLCLDVAGQPRNEWGACQSVCSTTEPGNTLIEILLRGDSVRDAQPSRAPAVDITTYVDGFERNRFLTLSLDGAPPTLIREPGTYSTGRVPRPLRDAPAPGLESVSVRTRVGALQSTTPLLFALPRPPQEADVLVTLDQASPGQTYFLRPSGTRLEPLVCRAAICPTDFVTPR